MDERLIKQWKITENLLAKAAVQVAGSVQFKEYAEFVEHNELGLALNSLAGIEEHSVNAAYWRLLKRAAEVMGQRELVKECRRRFQVARKRDAQPALQADSPAGRVHDEL